MELINVLSYQTIFHSNSLKLYGLQENTHVKFCKLAYVVNKNSNNIQVALLYHVALQSVDYERT